MEEAAGYYDQFKKEGAEILSVSTNTVFVHKAWHDNSSSIATIAYPMVADPTVRLCCYFGTYIEEVGLSVRGSFIIDPDRVLKAMDVHDNSIGKNAEEILRKLQAASFVRPHQGGVCPQAGGRGRKPSNPDWSWWEKSNLFFPTMTSLEKMASQRFRRSRGFNIEAV